MKLHILLLLLFSFYTLTTTQSSWTPVVRGQFPYLTTVVNENGFFNAILIVNQHTVLTTATFVTKRNSNNNSFRRLPGQVCVDENRLCMDFQRNDVKLLTYNNTEQLNENNIAIIALPFAFIERPQVKSIFPYELWVTHTPGTPLQILSLQDKKYFYADAEISKIVQNRPNVKIIVYNNTDQPSIGSLVIFKRTFENYLLGLYINEYSFGYANVYDLYYYRDFILENSQ